MYWKAEREALELNAEDRGSLRFVTHRGNCVKDSSGGPFCVLCGNFSGAVDAEHVTKEEIDTWLEFRSISKILFWIELILAVSPLFLVLFDFMFGWSGLSYFEIKAPSRRGGGPWKYIDFITPLYCLVLLQWLIEWSYIDRIFIARYGFFPSKMLSLLRIIIAWVCSFCVYVIFLPSLEGAKSYLIPLPMYSQEEIVGALSRVHLSLLLMVVAYAIVLTINIIVCYWLRLKIKNINIYLATRRRPGPASPQFEEGWG